MSIIPVHLQRRFEQRWATRFGSLVSPTSPKERRNERIAGQHAPRAAKAEEKPAGLGRRLRIDLSMSPTEARP
jgi:hypothetical protein